MRLNRNKCETILFSTLILMWVATVAIFRWVLPEYQFEGVHLVPVLFIALGFYLMNFLQHDCKLLARGIINVRKVWRDYRIFRIVKLSSCAILVFCLWRFLTGPDPAFFITFAVFFIAFTVMETIIIRAYRRNHCSGPDSSQDATA